ncbi:DNA repair protein [Aureococcus anophagefferens]|uniref:DNA repair protein n=1 Tax=Aureococcus anophagefferens TaxID=44056 RepID=A0ABR1FL82_AURAN
MGVQGLWKLLAPCGRRISVETLEHTTLAIDVSIWLTQFVKAMRDDEGRPIRNAHLIGTLRRVAKLLYHGVRPVFVFDGGVPVVKALIRQRQMRREKNRDDVATTAKRLLAAQLKAQALRLRKRRRDGDDAGDARRWRQRWRAAPRRNAGRRAAFAGGFDPGAQSSARAPAPVDDADSDDDVAWESDDGSSFLKGAKFRQRVEAAHKARERRGEGAGDAQTYLLRDDDVDADARGAPRPAWALPRANGADADEEDDEDDDDDARAPPRRRRGAAAAARAADDPQPALRAGARGRDLEAMAEAMAAAAASGDRCARRARLRRRGRAREAPRRRRRRRRAGSTATTTSRSRPRSARREPRREMSRSSRDADSVTEDMREDTMHLLRLLGVPYVVAPMEAEAQCAALEAAGLCEGVAYYASDCARDLRLGRDEFCALALLLGGDYDNAASRGWASSSAMEVLQAFHFVDAGEPRDRAEVKELHPDFSLGDVGRELGARWKALSDDDKKPYAALATADAERYDREMAAYKGHATGRGRRRRRGGGGGGRGARSRARRRARAAAAAARPLLAEEPGGPDDGVGRPRN